MSIKRKQQEGGLDLGELDKFLLSDFDVAGYTRAAVNSESELKSLKHHLDTVEKAISTSVVTHEDALLSTLECVTKLKREMIQSKTDSSALVSNITRVESDFGEPLARLKLVEQSLANAHAANAVLRRLGWFLQARKKLAAIPDSEESSAGGKEACRAAQLIGELEELVQEGGLVGVHVVDGALKAIKERGTKVRLDTQRCLEQAIKSKNQGEIALGLQAYAHLGVLEDRLQYTTSVWAVREVTQDIRELLKEGDSSLQQLRVRMDRLMEVTLRAWAVQIWNLQRVVVNKRFRVKQPNVFDLFWQKVCAAVEQEIKTCNRWTKESLVEDYARLRKSARAMLNRLWTSTSNVLGKRQASAITAAVGGPKESQPLMRALVPLLTEFLARSMHRLTQPVHVMFPQQYSAQQHHPPTVNDVQVFAQLVHKELLCAVSTTTTQDVVVDHELLGAISKCCYVALHLFAERCELQLVRDESAHQFRGLAQLPTTSTVNASAAPVSTQTSAQERNLVLLRLVNALASRVRDTLVFFHDKCMAEAGAPTVASPALEEEVENGEEGDNVTDDDEDEEEQQPQPVAPNALQKLQQGLDALEQLEQDILHLYLGDGAGFAFHALDKVLQDINHAVLVYESAKPTDKLPASSFAIRFQRAVAVFVDEHASKLPASSHALLGQLQQRLQLRLAMRVCSLPLASFSDQGRSLLSREVAVAFQAIQGVVTGSLPSPLESQIGLLIGSSSAQEHTEQLSPVLRQLLLSSHAAKGSHKTLTQWLDELETQY
ncbi:hypothetical protein BASA81_000939 [Batrachochytrium salamandrivorans]|nr:hypothetical protein BASA81_000939 [Batrachochytrium salamandrivorans]